MIPRNVAEERLRFTTDLGSAVEASDIIFIAVGTPPDEDGSADMRSSWRWPSRSVGRMNGRKIVVNKSTVPVGTAARIREVMTKAHDPPRRRRLEPRVPQGGAAVDDFLKPDRVVIGTDDAGVEQVMRELYAPFVRTGNPILVMDHASAEMTKYAANAMLATRISFMNEIANLCDRVGADVRHVRLGMGIGHAHRLVVPVPGRGLRRLVLPEGRQGADPHGSRRRLRAACRGGGRRRERSAEDDPGAPGSRSFSGGLEGTTVAIWGLAFKPRTDDMREAPALAIIEALLRAGAKVRAYDPEAMRVAREQLGERVQLLPAQLRCLRGRRRPGRRHRVERVPGARLRPHQVADCGGPRSSTAATSTTPGSSGSWASTTRVSVVDEGARDGRGGLHRLPRGP